MELSEAREHGTSQVLSVLEETSESLRHLGFQTRPHSEASRTQFQQLPDEIQKQITRQSLDFLDLVKDFQATKSKKSEVSEERRLVALALQKFRLKLKVEMLQPEDNDIVEIYDSQGRQVFRNFEFFRQCSYDLLTLQTFPWEVLYERPSIVTERLLEAGKRILFGGEVLVNPENQHTLKERYSGATRVFRISTRWAAPLYNEHDVIDGFIHFVRSEIISEGDDASKVQHL